VRLTHPDARRDTLLRRSAQLWSAASLAVAFFLFAYPAGPIRLADVTITLALFLCVAAACHHVTSLVINRIFGPRKPAK
jgi:peptidoglycan/LPS O-acetylase OafA/YrhL